MSEGVQLKLPNVFGGTAAQGGVGSPKEHRCFSMFTGVGGLDLGIELAGEGKLGFEAWVELDSNCRRTLRGNFPQIDNCPELLFEDATQLSPKTVMYEADLKPKELFLLAGGPPCQAFSTAGLRSSLNDARGSAVTSYFQMVKSLQPRFFVFENVRGLLSSAINHRKLCDRESPQEVAKNEDERLGSVFHKIVLPSFKRLGYEVVYGVVNAANYGTAQVRHRVLIMGSREREFGSAVFRKQTSHRLSVNDLLPATHHRLAPYPPIKPWRTLRDAIGHLDPNVPDEQTYTYSTTRAAKFKGIPMGANWKYVRDNPSDFPAGHLEYIMGGALASGGGKEGFYRRLDWDAPAPTLTCQPQQLATSLCHPEIERPLSIAEYSAIQDFPDSFKFFGSKSSQYRQIGNAVPVRLARAIGSLLLAISSR